MEDRAVVEALLGEEGERVRGLRRALGVELDRERCRSWSRPSRSPARPRSSTRSGLLELVGLRRRRLDLGALAGGGGRGRAGRVVLVVAAGGERSADAAATRTRRRRAVRAAHRRSVQAPRHDRAADARQRSSSALRSWRRWPSRTTRSRADPARRPGAERDVARAPWLWPRAAAADAAASSTARAAAGTSAPAPARSSTWRRSRRPPRVSPAPERVLDLGTGTGEAALFLAREFPRASVRGVDLSEEMIRAARGKVGLDPEGRVAFKVADAAHLPYDDDSFDLVAQVNMPPFFAEIARVLRPGGPRRRRRELGAGDARSTPRRRCSSAAFAASGIEPLRQPEPPGRAPTSSAARAAGRLTGRCPRSRRRYLLLVNPSAGGGRARELLPRVERGDARARASSTGPCSPTGIEHGCEEARRGGRGRRDPGRDERRRADRPGRRRARRRRGAPLGVIPGGRGNDLARVLGIPDRRRGRGRRCSPAGATREIDVGEVNGKRFLCIASCGFDSDANRIANEARLRQGQRSSTPYAALRALAAWKPATLHAHARRRARAGHRLLGRRRQQQGLRRRHVSRPRRGARRRPARRRRDRQRRQAPLPARAAEGLQGRAPRGPRGPAVARARGARSRPTARSPSTRTATTSPTCRRPSACCRGRCG